ncbi:LamG domain-containing protein [bacterium]|nr:LamG domain-containing protein [Akkermansiaceae bacterium]MDB4288735.1 LamG domain-containing protein [bacterium]MDB4282044.1 LamG domain-containing protein [Akkermansiaceae bacterium]MDB4310721.1 LamG domain-containing protein [Akkermansiaceae bacterium]MDB4317205.1 LamG domain-containing protein [bacterium]
MNTKDSFPKIAFLIVGLSGSAMAQIVYQDTFDKDGLDVNIGTGGGGAAAQFNTAGGYIWNDAADDDEHLSTGPGAGSGGHITTFFTENSFNVSAGFTLEVVFNMNSNAAGDPFPSNHFSFGLVADAETTLNGLFSSNSQVPSTDGIGFSLGVRNGAIDEGLLDWDADGNAGAGQQTTQNVITFAAGADQTIILDVESDGTYTYTYGAITGSGTTAIDLNQTYFFKARTQGSFGNAIQSISLTTNSTQFAAPTIATDLLVHDLGQPINFTITFDSSSTSAELVNSTDPGTSIDLIAIDASDATPNDGQVIFTNSPATVGSNTYEVTASRAGIAALSESTELTVIDPADEAADNDFSLAIQADSPLFYYRFEDAAGSTFVRDSSGNRLHTNDFTVNLIDNAFGSTPSPGGLGNAADFVPIAGARGIRVPATSEMSESFTFTSLLNVSTTTFSNARNLLSMSSGTGTGANILSRLGSFRSQLDGANDILSADSDLPLDTTCLIHYVFTADDVNGGGTHVLYINGAEIGTAVTVESFAANEGNWIIGANLILGDPSWLDWIDEAAIFEEALTPAQITAHNDAFLAAADQFLGFFADTNEIAAGDPVTLSWIVSDAATSVSINGTTVDGSTAGAVYSQQFFPTQDTFYTISVDGPDGVQTAELNVTVTITPFSGPPIITSITSDQATPPNHTITMTANANTSYNVRASVDLNDGFPENVTTVTTDESGIGTKTFKGFGTREFYRLEPVPVAE